MSIEQLIFIAVFVLVALFNLIRQARSQRRPEGETAEGPPPVAEEPAAPRPPRPPRRVVIAVPAPVPAEPHARQPGRDYRPGPVAQAAPAPRVRRGRNRRLLASRGDVRRGIVLITVLGPCRGLESPSEPTGDIYTAALPR